jgi:hypothetical protein
MNMTAGSRKNYNDISYPLLIEDLHGSFMA